MNQYVGLDHAAWLQQQLDFMKKQQPKTYKDAPEKLNEFQRKVFNIIGIAGGGLYNSPISFNTIKWNYGIGGNGISMSWINDMATFDSDKLTLLVFLCHEARIRCQIDATGPKRIQLSFFQRKAEGRGSVRHPNLDEAVKEFREWFKQDHMINHTEPEEKSLSDIGPLGDVLLEDIWRKQ